MAQRAEAPPEGSRMESAPSCCEECCASRDDEGSSPAEGETVEGESAQENPATLSVGSLSGYMFGDFYWMAANHEASIEDERGFWFRRIYFTYDQPLERGFDIRFRVELNSPGDFESSSKLEPFIKDAYLRWRNGEKSVYLGISPTPTWDVVERIWGYRAVEKTALDLQKFGSSRDFGVALRGSLGAAQRVNYHVMFGNGSGTGSETNEGKKIFTSLGFKATDNLFFEVYGDWDNRPATTDRFTWQVFAAYQRPDYRLGVQFAQQARQQGKGLENSKLEVASAFFVRRLSERINFLARADRVFDPNPAGAKISYLPFDPSAPSTLALAGIDYTPHSNVHLIPNVEFVRYDERDGERPDDDVMVRGTFYYIWR